MGRKKSDVKPPEPFEGFSNERHHIRIFDILGLYSLYVLDGYALQVYMALRFEYKGENYNAGLIICPYSFIAEKTGIKSRNVIKKRIDDLERLGFIDVIMRGGLFREPNRYKLSDRWKNTEEFKAWSVDYKSKKRLLKALRENKT